MPFKSHEKICGTAPSFEQATTPSTGRRLQRLLLRQTVKCAETPD